MTEPNDVTISGNWTDVQSSSQATLVASTIQALVDSLFAGNYEILAPVGQGGMSAVFKARHRVLNRTVAIKMLHPHLISSTNLQRFKQEAQAISALSHPNTVAVFDIGIPQEGSPCLVMDYIEGISLSDLLKHGPLTLDQAISITLQACDALSHAHEKGIVHRDLKPSNIMLVRNGDDYVVKIVDFGIAKFSNDNDSQQLTRTGEVFGSPPYMSPEQCAGRHMDLRSDIYSLGCVLYEMLSGKPPFLGENVLETIHLHLSALPASLKIRNCSKSTEQRLDAIIFKALEKQPEKRQQTMEELKADLKKVIHSESLGPLSSLQDRVGRAQMSVRRFCKDHPIQSVVLALALVCAIGGTAVSNTVYGALNSQLSVRPIAWTLVEKEVPVPPNYEMNFTTSKLAVDRIADAIGPLTFDVVYVRDLRKLAAYAERYHDWANAVGYRQRLVQILEARDGENSLSTAHAALDYARDCIKVHQFGTAGKLLRAAEKVFKDTLGEGPKMRELYLLLGMIADLQGNYDEALPYLEKGTEYSDPNYSAEYAQCVSRLADIYALKGDPRADQAYEVAIKVWTRRDDAFNRAVAQSRLGSLRFKSGQYASSVELMSRSLDVLQGYPELNLSSLRDQYGTALWKQGQFLAAIQQKLRAQEEFKERS